MCGIAGFLGPAWSDPDKVTANLASMGKCLLHRGPDDCGIWNDAESGIGVAHRRLSILDLSGTGHQPMHSPSGRYVVVFNGEIYNHLSLRLEIFEISSSSFSHPRSVVSPSAAAMSVPWRGHSDTETLLAAFDLWGIESSVKKMVGMFAFAVWDRQDRKLFLVRDRIGEKPLYYGRMGDVFLFGSELKSLKAHPAWRGEIDRNAITLYLRYNYIPAPYTIYQGIHKLLPGTILTIDHGVFGRAHDSDLLPTPYWEAKNVVEHGLEHPFSGSEADAVSNLDALLRDVVSHQMIADVPLGAFLSGGIDSSTIVAIMQAQSPKPVRTFTIGFSEEGYNEADDARAVARYLKTDHTELYVSPTDALTVIPQLPSLYDEPFSDSSQIPTYLISKLTRNHVTVSLSGDGGDELFGGYNRYSWVKDIWKKVGWLPVETRKLLAAALESCSASSWDRLFHVAGGLLPRRFLQRTPGNKLHKLAHVLSVQSQEDMYQRLVSH